ncbi:hypothetical protein FHS72_001715 [Loktanella ponticola]|uniref:Hedgehog/Intein (Hint) domain-containing protein n=1 Tax=Yoonia ponticola TaxID=1524255 RepID=A0A7W9BKA4_9RHOB|nr:Hint domain-containing protein [Yoonia ponticola]MBB5722091.1 hypothetical protein [Yoonia ponticola]
MNVSGDYEMHTEMTATAAPTKTKVAVQTGICAGTSIMTLDGEMPIEHLSVGDRVITRDSGMSVIKEISVSKQLVQPISIKAGSLGHTRPDRDMVVTAGAKLHIRDWRAEALFGKAAASVPAARLVDGEFLTVAETCEMAVYHIIFDREHIVYADGIEMIAGA